MKGGDTDALGVRFLRRYNLAPLSRMAVGAVRRSSILFVLTRPSFLSNLVVPL